MHLKILPNKNSTFDQGMVAQMAEPVAQDRKVSGPIPAWIQWGMLLIMTCVDSRNVIIEFENEKIISQFVGIVWCCDISGDRVSKNKKENIFSVFKSVPLFEQSVVFHATKCYYCPPD